jgi:hypothetical protein
MGHCQGRLGLSKATWANLIATRYNMGPWESNQGGGAINNERTDNSGGRDRRNRCRGLLSPLQP